jgi:hypothetical protein
VLNRASLQQQRHDRNPHYTTADVLVLTAKPKRTNHAGNAASDLIPLSFSPGRGEWCVWPIASKFMPVSRMQGAAMMERMSVYL